MKQSCAAQEAEESACLIPTFSTINRYKNVFLSSVSNFMKALNLNEMLFKFRLDLQNNIFYKRTRKWIEQEFIYIRVCGIPFRV